MHALHRCARVQEVGLARARRGAAHVHAARERRIGRDDGDSGARRVARMADPQATDVMERVRGARPADHPASARPALGPSASSAVAALGSSGGGSASGCSADGTQASPFQTE